MKAYPIISESGMQLGVEDFGVLFLAVQVALSNPPTP